MPKDLDPDGRPVFIAADVVLETPGLAGTAELAVGAGPGMRAAEAISSSLEAALRGTDLFEQLTIVIAGATEVPPLPGGVSRSTARGEPALVAEVPGPGDGFHQLLLAADEAGVITWCLPEPSSTAAAEVVHRSGDRRRYVISRRVTATPPSGSRGLFGALGRKVLKVVAFKAIELVGGAVGAHFVGRWEEAKRWYAVRSFTPDDYTSPKATPIGGDDWERLAGGPALLFLHGTFSRAHRAFGQLPRGELELLHRKYEGRVLAFDHPTASHTPGQNAAALLDAVPDGVELELDIVSHSRGGLVGRVLAEQRPAGGALRTRNLVFVAVPNAGTALASPSHLGDFIDSYTNLLSFFPDNGVTDALEILITVVKQLAVGSLEGLDGLQAMNPDGAWLRGLNAPATNGDDTVYRAVAADFEPVETGLKDFAKDRIMDAVFAGARNDLVVPTSGVFGANGSTRFPIEEPLVIPASEGVWHSGYFGRDDVLASLREWLPG